MTSTLSFLQGLVLRTPLYAFGDIRSAEQLLADPVFRLAVFLASKAFYQALEARDFDYAALSGRERLTLEKYINRIRFRPTPFGLFAAVSAVCWKDQGPIVVADPGQVLLQLLPDQSAVLAEAGKVTALLCSSYELNPTWYAAGREYRFIRSESAEDGRVHFLLESFENNPLTRALYKWLSRGPVSGSSLAGFLVTTTGCSQSEAQEYLQFLIGAQIIRNRRMVNIIGGTGNVYVARKAAFCAIAELSGKSFYANSVRAASGGLAVSHQGELRSALAALEKLTPVNSPPLLEEFARAFSSRFEGQKISLMEALDPEVGVGYGSFASHRARAGLLKGLGFNESSPEPPLIPWSDVHRMLLSKWQALPPQELVIRISAADLEGLTAQAAPLPPSIAVMFRLAGEGLLIESAGGATGTALIGRFSLFSPELHELARSAAQGEMLSNPGVVFADIGQLSDSHTDNINRRLAIYDHEIPINCASMLPSEKQVWPSDLVVSVRSGMVILESRRLKKRVIPRLATAYNFRHNHLALFRFLCDLQFQGLHADLSFNLESYFPGMDAYPRVQYEQTILSPARWQINNAGGKQNAAALRSARGMPRYLSLAHFDRQLTFDLDDPAQCARFDECIAGMSTFTLQEALLPGSSPVTLEDGSPVINQFVTILVNKQQVYQQSVYSTPARVRSGRQFILGSEWLYYKIYCSPETADELLARRISAVLKQLGKARTLEWFFIRYNDPGYHIRLRIRIDRQQLGLAVALFKKQFSDLVRDRIVREFKADTYRPEIERYGAELIRCVETCFHASSAWVLYFLEQKQRQAHADDRLAIEGASMVLDQLIGNQEQKIAFLKQVHENFLAEFRADKALRVELDALYREKRYILFEHQQTQSGEKFKRNFARALAGIASKSSLFTAARRQSLAADLVHMHINRVYSQQQRHHELVLYYCMHKQQLALRGRAKNSAL